MTTIMAIRLDSVVTAINVLVASGFSIAAIIRPEYLVPAESVPTEASLLFGDVRGGAHNSSSIVRTGGDLQAGDACVADPGCARRHHAIAGIGLFEHDLGKCAGPLSIAVLQFFVVYLLHRSVRITLQTKRG